jgi:hypothetical protein
MLEQLINDTYLSVVAFGFRRASAKACPDAETTPNGPSTESPRKFVKNSPTRIVNLAARGMLVVSVARRLGSEGPLLAYCAAPL